MRTMDGDEELQEQLGKRPPALQMFETAIAALQKPVAVLLNAAAAVCSMRFLTAFLQVVLEVHAEHDHIAPGWTGMSRWRIPAPHCIQSLLNFTRKGESLLSIS